MAKKKKKRKEQYPYVNTRLKVRRLTRNGKKIPGFLFGCKELEALGWTHETHYYLQAGVNRIIIDRVPPLLEKGVPCEERSGLCSGRGRDGVTDGSA